MAPNIEKLRGALTQRAAEWKATLREEPKVARLLLRRLIGPLVLTDDSQRPDWIDAEAEVKTTCWTVYMMWRPQPDQIPMVTVEGIVRVA